MLSTGERYQSGAGVGGRWEEIGRLQFLFLKDCGLTPQHRLLDVGCGSLRGGVHFVGYLDDGNYYGMDHQQWLLTAAVEVELPRYSLTARTVHLRCDADFGFGAWGVTFEYALAQSVFTHLSWDQIRRCLANMAEVLAPHGRFYATYLEDAGGTHQTTPMTHGSSLHATPITSYPDRDPYHYEFGVFEELADRTGLAVQRLGDWGHPRDHHYMMLFTPR
ncbi:MAG: class I SAM-dependent methyltransferase [Planctomycetota bacterium]